MTKETVGMTIFLFSVVALLILLTGPVIFGDIGLSIDAFFIGLFGFYVYPMFAALILVSLMMIAGKKFIPKGWLLRGMLFLLAVFAIVHTATAERFFGNGYGAYLGGCWSAAEAGIAQGTGCGVVFGLVAYPVRLVLAAAGSYVLFSALALVALFFLLALTPLRNLFRVRRPREELHADKPREEMTFGDLPEPARRGRDEEYGRPLEDRAAARPSAPERGYPDARGDVRPRETRDAYPEPAPQTPEDLSRRSREILFGNSAEDYYRTNLIFDSNSSFNTRTRGTSEPPAPSVPGYAGSYAAEAERTRTSMPKRVHPVEPAPRDSSLNYPTPSYRAPSAPPPRTPDYYSQDVASQEPPRSPEPKPDMGRPDPLRSETRDLGRTDPLRSDSRDLGRSDPLRSESRDLGRTDPLRSESRDLGRTDPLRSETRDLGRTDPLRPESRDLGRTDPLRPETRDLGRTDPLRSETRDLGRTDPLRPETRDMGRSDPLRPAEEPAAPSRSADLFSRTDRAEPAENFKEKREERPDPGPPQRSDAHLFDDDFSDDEFTDLDEPAPQTHEEPRSVRGLGGLDASRSEPAPRLPERPEEIPARAEEAQPMPAPAPVPKPKKKHVWKRYKRPDLSLLDSFDDKPHVSNEEIGAKSGSIIDTFRRYRLETSVMGVKAGASFTRFDLEMPENATIPMVTKYAGELAMYLRVDHVRVFSNPSVRGISIEVPNEKRSIVGLRSVLNSEAFNRDDPEALMFALGEDVEGTSICGNITDMTHILIAGMTGSGKSITMHAMLISLLYKYSPEDLRIILIDPKQTEFVVYEGLPHLMINEIITDVGKAVMALNWAIKEMERRYTLFNEKTREGLAVRKVDEYNAALSEGEEKLPKILIVIDEFADLMMMSKKEIEEKIQRLTQKARAAGIHLVLATQRPSAEIITGVIKSNLPTRISLSVDSELNSRIILDETGAETLLGHGDMFIKAGGKTVRAQGAYLSPRETQAVVNYIKENNEAYFDEEVSGYIDRTGGSSYDDEEEEQDVPEAYIRSLAIVVKLGQASISLIQRKCSVGYNHAGKIIEWMERMGYISEFDGKAKARNVLLTKEEFEAKYGPLD